MTLSSASGSSDFDTPPTHDGTAHRATPRVLAPRQHRAARRAFHLGGLTRHQVFTADVEQLREPTRAALALRTSLVHGAERGMARTVTRGTRRARHDRADVGFDAGTSKPDNPEAEDRVMTRD